MDAKTLSVLEWTPIVTLLAGHATTPMGRARCEAIEVHTDLEHVSHALRLTSEARDLLVAGADLPFGGLPDAGPPLLRIQQGAVLDGPELRGLGELMAAAGALRRFLEEHAADAGALSDLGEPIVPQNALVSEVRRCFEPSGEVSDHASPQLAGIRQKIRKTQAEVRDRLQRMVASHAQHLQDPIVTVRGDRFVLPVRAEAKNHVPGIVHDQSGSGATLFIEPMAVVPLNNALREAQLTERDEVRKVLVRLTDALAEVLPELRAMAWAVAEVDFQFAKARFAERLGGSAPHLDREGRTELYAARHPLLVARGTRVVPIDVAIGHPHTVLLITGPNTGGKTVTLKTLGLVTLMAQAGLHPPVAPTSRVAIYPQVFADIGDEQSLAQNLSTFSGHMTNLIRILRGIAGPSLVLLDELGAGTDPAEGAAIARAFVEAVQERGARLVATTHYGELKTLAWTVPAVANAAVEFDPATLGPTYRLLMGVPGQSNAITIAAGLGLPAALVHRAEELLVQGRGEAEHLLADLEADRLQAAQEREAASRERQEAARLRELLERDREAQEERRIALAAAARAEIDAEVARARQEVAAVIRELQGAPTAAAAQKAQDRLSKLKARAPRPERRGRGPRGGRPLVLGDRVYLPRIGQVGVVQTAPDPDGTVVLQVGIMRVNAKVSELTDPPKDLPKAPRRSSAAELASRRDRKPTTSFARDVGVRCDLRGLQAHEALSEVEGYLDAATRQDLKEVSLIHGVGTGALLKAVRAYLADSPYVAAFRPADRSEGGDGVTIVTLA